MLESKNHFQRLDLSFFEIVALLNMNIFLFFKKFILSYHFFLLFFLKIDFYRKNFLKIFLQSLKFLRCYSNDSSIYSESNTPNEFGIFSIPIEKKLQEEVSLPSFIRFNNCWKRNIMLKLILNS